MAPALKGTDKQRVLKKRPGAWWCGCGCRAVFNRHGQSIGVGNTPREAWKDAAKRQRV